MSDQNYSVRATWRLFSAEEKRNIAIYILGIMLYKFGLEAFNGSIIALATNRYDYEASLTKTTAKTFERIGLLVGLNQAFQCVGSILIAPLIVRFPTRLVLSSAILVFGLLTAIIMIVDAATGGYIRPNNWHKVNGSKNFAYYGDYNTDGIIPLYCITGIAYGMVELIRRVIPKDIVGGNVQKLRRMDALVHIFYEVAGTAGSFTVALALIPRFGNNYSFVITPIFFTAASITWFFISNLNFKGKDTALMGDQPTYIRAVAGGFVLFYQSIAEGANIIFSSRKFIWLLPGYTVALYGHRYLENGIAPALAARVLGNSAWSQIMVGGSNFGELLGAASVLLMTKNIRTPLPWLRLDALMLLIVWYLPYWTPPKNMVKYAWMVAGTFIPISYGWAAGDVSLAAFIQASLARMDSKKKNVSSLGAVMAVLYSTYIVMYAIVSPLLGRYIDRVSKTNNGAIQPALQNIAGVHFTVIAIVVLAATFVPKGAFAFNPSMIDNQALDSDVDTDFASEDIESELKDGLKHNAPEISVTAVDSPYNPKN